MDVDVDVNVCVCDEDEEDDEEDEDEDEEEGGRGETYPTPNAADFGSFRPCPVNNNTTRSDALKRGEEEEVT